MKKLLATILLAAGLGVTGTTAVATPGWSTTWIYYADENLTQQVGWKQFTCQGRTIRSGVQTPYFDVSEDAC